MIQTVFLCLDAGEGALNHRLVKVEFQFLWLRGTEGIPVRFPNALRAGGIKLHDTIEIPPVVGNPNASWIARVMAPSGRWPQAPCRERCSFHSALSSKICFLSLRNSILSGLTASFVVSHSDWRRGRDSDPLSRKKSPRKLGNPLRGVGCGPFGLPVAFSPILPQPTSIGLLFTKHSQNC
jgi:hypothetical protein